MSAPPIQRIAICLISDLLGIPPEQVTSDQLFSYGIGWLDAGACCVNWRPGRAVAPAISATGIPYAIALHTEWPNPAPTDLITDGGDA